MMTRPQSSIHLQLSLPLRDVASMRMRLQPPPRSHRVLTSTKRCQLSMSLRQPSAPLQGTNLSFLRMRRKRSEEVSKCTLKDLVMSRPNRSKAISRRKLLQRRSLSQLVQRLQIIGPNQHPWSSHPRWSLPRLIVSLMSPWLRISITSSSSTRPPSNN